MNWVSNESVLVLEDMVMMVIHYGHGYNEVESTKISSNVLFNSINHVCT